MRKIITALVILAMLVSAAACSSGDNAAPSNSPYATSANRQAMSFHDTAPSAPSAVFEEAEMDFAFAMAADADDSAFIGAGSAPEPSAPRERLIIQTAWTEMETEDFDNTIAALRGLPARANGYVESEQLFAHRVFNMTMRIPTASFEDVLSQVQSLADVRTSSQEAEDVTDQFFDMEASLATRRIEEERLLALIDAADNVEDLLELESRLSRTRLQIETYRAQLANLSGRIAYSTIFITLFDIGEEVFVPVAGPSLGERIGGAFGESVDSVIGGGQNFVVFVAGAIIPLVIWGAIIFAVYKIARRIVRKMRKPRQVTDKPA